jgi:aconitate hydratase 2/2-methylisocitrate dehydratase
MLEAYHQHVAGISPLPLNAQQTAELCEILKNPPEELKGELLTLNEVLELSDLVKSDVIAGYGGDWRRFSYSFSPGNFLHQSLC